MLTEERLVSQIRNVTFENLSKEVVERIKTILLHDLFVGSVGRNQKEYKFLTNTFPNKTLMDNIFREAVAMSLPTLEDFYGANHFGPLIIPNALYHGLETQVSGKQLISALAAGFLLGISLSDLIGVKIAEKGLRGTSILGIIAASASAAHISRSSEQEILHILAHSSANAFGISSSLFAGTSEWKYQAGLGAFHAAFANMLAKNGEVGNVNFLTGNNGFSEVFTGKSLTDLSFDTSTLLQIGIKRDPVHIFVLSPVAASKQLFKRFGPFSHDEINTIKIKISPKQLSAANLQKGPYENTNQAIISTYTNVAITLLYGYTSSEHLKMANKPEVLRITEKIEVLPDDKIKEYECEIVIVLDTFETKCFKADGNVSDTYFPTFKTEKELLMKEAVQWGVTPEYVERLSDEVEQLVELDCITSLMEIYENGPHGGQRGIK
jgi:hypothetical protein